MMYYFLIMKNIKKAISYFKKSMATKYIVAFIFIIVIPTFLIGVMLNKIFINILLKNTSEIYYQSLGRTVSNIEDEIRTMSLITSTISNNNEILKLLSNYYQLNSNNEKFNYSKKIDSNLDFIFNYSNRIDSVIFFYKGGDYYYYKNYPVLDESRIRELDWYKENLNNPGKTRVLSIVKTFTYNTTDIYLVSVVMGIPGSINKNEIELVYLSFRLNFLDELNYGNFNDSEEILLVDENNDILISSNKEKINKKMSDFIGESDFNQKGNIQKIINTKYDKKILFTSYDIPKSNWYLISIIDYKNITKKVDYFYNMIKIIFIFFVILFILFSFIFFINIINPVKKLTKKMNEVEKGNFNVNIESAGFDEIFILNESFNSMIKEIDNLTKEKVKAEIEALQYQINPHFISNTLNSIRLMAMMAKKENIQNMSEALIRFMLNVFKNKGEMTTIKDEIENLENYVYIMKVRFGDKFNIQYNIEKEQEDLFILRMIIQPVIENSILHGLSEVSENGLIKISVYTKNETLLIEVVDNGEGIKKKEIKNILTEAYASNHQAEKCIGLINVDSRIKLFHGTDYGLSIKSIYGKYTKVIYSLPIINEASDV